MKSAETRSTWLSSKFRVVVPGAVLAIWMTDKQMRVALRLSYTYVRLPQESRSNERPPIYDTMSNMVTNLFP
jgi:hypothetical protein